MSYVQRVQIHQDTFISSTALKQVRTDVQVISAELSSDNGKSVTKNDGKILNTVNKTF